MLKEITNPKYKKHSYKNWSVKVVDSNLISTIIEKVNKEIENKKQSDSNKENGGLIKCSEKSMIKKPSFKGRTTKVVNKRNDDAKKRKKSDDVKSSALKKDRKEANWLIQKPRKKINGIQKRKPSEFEFIPFDIAYLCSK